ncbi:helix-turn-helix domain-containing protein [Rosistilla oblonga]|uniref:HTH cro/C1-type domain-containing protein n=1 Tax=Rosistilla oblonga TaxID=2527990 RepID=A0A518IXZ0_9BACT|nr:helix-turn-helix domain-containing protein [Rosistilla oblonga]QDV57946.1 hypothetical protein Mal33_39620 [Rosistilla oblonga]
MNPSNDKTVGGELLERLGKFTKALEHTNSSADLPAILTVRKVKSSLSPHVYSGQQIKAIRLQLRVSQPVFADYLGLSVATLRDWEQGISQATGPMCRLLEEIERDVPLWAKRLREMAEVGD